MAGSVLTLHAGSSSLKFALLDVAALAPIVPGAIADIHAQAHLTLQCRTVLRLGEKRWFRLTRRR